MTRLRWIILAVLVNAFLWWLILERPYIAAGLALGAVAGLILVACLRAFAALDQERGRVLRKDDWRGR